MMGRLLLILRLVLCLACILPATVLVPSLLLAATVFIDPTCSNNGDGTAGSPCASGAGAAGPKNTWVGLTWTAGNTYAGQGGTSQSLASFQVGGSGTAGNPITLTSYGTGQFKFTSSSTYALATVSRSYLTFTNLVFESTATNCHYLTGIGSNLIVSGNTYLTCGPVAGTTSAVLIEGASNTADMDAITVTANTFTDIMGWAVRVNDVNIGNASAWDGLTISSNLITNAGNGGNTGAIKVGITATSTATFTNLKITDNIITLVGDEEASPVHAIQVVRTTDGTVHEDRFLGVQITGNSITHGGGGIYVNHLGVLAGVQNTVSGNTISDVNATVGLIGFYSTAWLVELNKIDNVRTYAAVSFLDGSGIDVDLGNSDVTVRRNIVSNCLGNAAQPTNSGAGMEMFGSNNVKVYGNIFKGNKMGIFIGDDSAGSPGPNEISGNDILNSTVSGIHQVLTSNQDHTIKNNIIYGSGAWGINNLNETDAVLQTNLLFGNASGNYNSQTPGGSDLLVDPRFISTTDFRLAANSPARQAGTYTVNCMDYRGRTCYQPYDIGAYQRSGGDPASARVTATARATASTRAIATTRASRQ